MTDPKDFGLLQGTAISAAVLAGIAFTAPAARAEVTLQAAAAGAPITLDGDISDWNGVSDITVPLAGDGGVDAVELRAVVRGDTIYVLAVWDDPTEDILHKPYGWDEASQSYKKLKRMEDRLAISLRMSGNFSQNKMDGSEFVADVWHWKAARSNPAGVAHDKMWKVSLTPFEKGKDVDEKGGALKTPDGRTLYIARPSDAGPRLYKPVKYDVKQGDVMSRYEVNTSPSGSIADVKAKGVWRNGRWYLELARKLDTGNPDDAVIPASGSIEIAIAAFDSVGGAKHSVSETIVLKTQGGSS
ncbi:MAG: ethylbenzene dehydrogenase-related protein [Rhodospirillales bacterium]|nr:ethylbenzene dehydrogenase-related protein [Rhodospirillales bacterium]MDH3792499.1 ethylbenzene dehydrogenase-related protein [Rhodospirillales bacterium]MDH3913060.1 ethylbenzene dehydrogenase-related protein [Rhodospirillales bacterium]MDH3919963.1 ethylbenzene dehydrogenase-related protein [Rhodospirillales bacterium]MDH3968794.1 ethylbenzene dehydrogenase-related protein [Rhodospirillales bacterium]